MKRHVSPYPGRFRQHGYALLLMLVMVTMGILFTIVSQVSPSGMKWGHEQKTSDALAQAKEALIGYAAMHASVPGALPCPDTSNSGTPNMTGTNCVAYIGRVPWKKLGLADLRDGASECLWYALSPRFRDVGLYNINRSVAGLSSLNSGVPGSLVVKDGQDNALSTSPAIAIIFAPGTALSGQDRSAVGTTSCGGNTTATNYLDIGPSPGFINNATGNGAANLFVTAAATDTFNDKLILITAQDLSGVVDKRVIGEIRANLKQYYDTNGTLPDAASSPDTGTASAGLTTGYIPWWDLQPPPFISGLTSNAKNGWYSLITYQKTSSSEATLTTTPNGKSYVLSFP